MFVISIVTSKGGSGKTTVSANLAARFSKWGTGAVIDLDPQGNLTRAFPVTEWGSGTTASVLTDAATDPHRVIEPDEWSVFQLPKGEVLYGLATTNQDRLSLCQEVLATTPDGGQVLARLLSSQTQLDFVIIDTPPSVGRLTFNAVAASDLVYTVINEATWSVEGGLATQSYVEALTAGGFSHARFGGAIVNRADRRTVVSRVIRGLVDQETKFPVLKPVLPTRVAVQEAEFRGVPVVALEPKNAFSKAFKEIAGQMWKEGQRAGKQQAREGEQAVGT